MKVRTPPGKLEIKINKIVLHLTIFTKLPVIRYKGNQFKGLEKYMGNAWTEDEKEHAGKLPEGSKLLPSPLL